MISISSLRNLDSSVMRDADYIMSFSWKLIVASNNNKDFNKQFAVKYYIETFLCVHSPDDIKGGLVI